MQAPWRRMEVSCPKIYAGDAILLIQKHTHDGITWWNFGHDMEHQPSIYSEKDVKKIIKDSVILNGSEMKLTKEITCWNLLRQ